MSCWTVLRITPTRNIDKINEAYVELSNSIGENNKDAEELELAYNKALSLATASIGDLISIMDDILPLVSTNLTNNEIISIVTTVLGMGIPHIEQASFPSVEKTKTIYTDMRHLTIDTDEITNDIHNFLYSSN